MSHKLTLTAPITVTQAREVSVGEVELIEYTVKVKERCVQCRLGTTVAGELVPLPGLYVLNLVSAEQETESGGRMKAGDHYHRDDTYESALLDRLKAKFPDLAGTVS